MHHDPGNILASNKTLSQQPLVRDLFCQYDCSFLFSSRFFNLAAYLLAFLAFLSSD